VAAWVVVDKGATLTDDRGTRFACGSKGKTFPVGPFGVALDASVLNPINGEDEEHVYNATTCIRMVWMVSWHGLDWIRFRFGLIFIRDHGRACGSRRSELTNYLGENPGGNLGTAQANPCCWLTPIGLN